MSKTTKPAAKAATTKTSAKTTAVNTNVPESGTVTDKAHPEIHPERHPGNGMQEMPTGGGATAGGDDKGGSALAGNHQAELAPNPSIGVNYQGDVAGAGTAPLDEDAIADQEFVHSYEHALSLPVLEEGKKGTPVKAPKEGSKAHKELNGQPVITAFKDAQRRTLQVVKTADGLAAQVVA